MKRPILPIFCFLFSILMLLAPAIGAQSRVAAGSRELAPLGLEQLVATPAVSGYENQLGDEIRAQLKSFHPVMDNLGDVVVTMGSGAPHRLIVTPMDEPGFVVSEITPDGYLRVQRLPQFGLPRIYNEMYSAQPVKIRTANGKWIDGVVAGLSVHLQPGRRMRRARRTSRMSMWILVRHPRRKRARRAWMCWTRSSSTGG